MHITSKVACLYPADGEVYSIQHYVIEFVSGLRQVICFLHVLQFPLQKKLTATYLTEILLKVALTTIAITLALQKYMYIYLLYISYKNDNECIDFIKVLL
jgi:hypothetical protein